MTVEEKITDDRVIDTSAAPYIRPRWVFFEAHGLRAGVEVRLTFDGRQLPISVSGGSDNIMTINGVDAQKEVSLFGTSFASAVIKTNASGSVSGWFYIPPNTFATGDKSVVVSDLDGSSSANATYTSRGTIVTRLQTITSIRTVERREGLTAAPESEAVLNITTRPVSGQDVAVVPSTGQVIYDFDIPTSGPIRYDSSTSRAGDPSRAPRWVDPVAQSFMVNTDGGCFVRSVSIFLATKPGDFQDTISLIDGVARKTLLDSLYPGGQLDDQAKTRPLSVYLVEMQNGEPTANIVPMSTVNVFPSTLVAHPTVPSLGENTITFANPIYLESGTQYAIVLFSSSKEYNVWTANIGSQDMFEAGSLVQDGDRKSNNTNAAIVGHSEDGTAFYLNRNSWRWDREGQAGLTFRVSICQFAPSATVVMTDSKNISDASYGGRVMKIWNSAETYPISAVVAYPVPDPVNPDGPGKKVMLFENDSGTPNGSGGHPINPVTLVSNPDWTPVTENVYDGKRNTENRYGYGVFPIVGEMMVNGTDISYDHNFVTGPSDGSFVMPSSWFVAKNNSSNNVAHLGNGSDLNGERIINNPASGNKNNYALRAHLRSNNPNVSPVLDKAQMRATMLSNIVLGVERDLLWGGKSFSQVQTTFENSGYDAAYALGRLVKNQAYSKNHVVFLADDEETFFVYASVSPKTYGSGLTNDQLISQFVDDVNAKIWVKNSNFRPPFIDGATGVGDCGTYVSKAINLAQPAADLKVILDVKTPGNSFVSLSYRFQKDEPQFLYTIPYDDNIGLDIASFIGSKVKVKYRGKPGNANALSSINPVTGTLSNQLVINGIEEYIVTGQPTRYRVFVSSVAEDTAFAEGITFASQEISGTQLFPAPFASVNTIFLVPDSIRDLEKIESTDPDPSLLPWSNVGAYFPGSLVLTMAIGGGGLNDIKNSHLWQSKAYIAAEWSNATAYTTGAVIIYRANSGNPFVAYRAVANSTGANPATVAASWLPLVQSNGAPWPAFGLGTAPSELGTAWQLIPSIAIASSLKQEETKDDWRPMISEQAVNTALLPDDKYYEWTFVPKVKPETEFTTYQVRIDLRNRGFDRVNVPSARNLRTIAVL